MHSSSKNIVDIIKESSQFPVGEYNVIPRDALIRFIATQPDELAQSKIEIIHEILDNVLGFFPKTESRADLQLNIPASHRYTKFGYVVDPFSLYIPYHYHLSELYGIYLRDEQISKDLDDFIKLAIFLLNDERFYERLRIPVATRRDIRSLLRHEYLSLGVLISLYFESIYLHALAHHVVEDISTFYEIKGLDKYSVIPNSREEEALCEYVMYEALRGVPGWNESAGGFALRLIYGLRDLTIIPPISAEDLMKFLKIFRSVVPQILYIHRNKELYKRYIFYKPNVNDVTSEKLSFIFNSFWLSHVNELEIMRAKIGGKEIFNRIFVIDL